MVLLEFVESVLVEVIDASLRGKRRRLRSIYIDLFVNRNDRVKLRS